MRAVKIKPLLSILLILVFMVVIATGIALDLAPAGRLAKEASWSFVGIERNSLEKIHTMLGYILGAIAFLHFLLNYKILASELKILFKK